MDHDQRFKVMLQLFFKQFLLLFFPAWAERLDFSTLTWLKQELFHDPPEGKRRMLDLVGQITAKHAIPAQSPQEPEDFTLVAHVEIESPDRISTFRPYMHRAYGHLREKYKRPVLPIALFLRVGLEGIGVDVYEEHIWEFCPSRFQYFYVGLPALDGIEYVKKENWLGVALSALMRVPKDKVAWLGAEALQRLHKAELTDQEKFLLGDCVQAYLPMDEEQKREFESLSRSPGYEGVKAMNKTPYDFGLEEGREQGLEKGRAEGQTVILAEQLEDRFGPLPVSARDRLAKLTADEARILAKAVLRAQSLGELGLGN